MDAIFDGMSNVVSLFEQAVRLAEELLVSPSDFAKVVNELFQGCSECVHGSTDPSHSLPRLEQSACRIQSSLGSSERLQALCLPKAWLLRAVGGCPGDAHG
jgi:hypothetical protein